VDEVSITAYPNGPYLVRGPVRVLDAKGEEIELRRRTIALCRCGRSRIHPFCDGTHKVTGFSSEPGGNGNGNGAAAKLARAVDGAADDAPGVSDPAVPESRENGEPGA
jgi:CDGSH-type Zn-finger protein